MKTWIKDKVYEFIEYIREVRNYTQETEKTYVINLKEAVKYIEVEKKADIFYIDLMPYRVVIKNLSKKTIYKKISIFKSFIKYLQNNGFKLKLYGDEAIKTEKTLPKPVKGSYILEALECVDLQEKLLVELVYSLGLRISEVENLKLESIKNSWVIVKGKGGKIRQLPLLKRVEKVLEKYVEYYAPKEYLFEQNGKKLSSAQLRYRVTKVFKEIGLKVTPHQLRHSFATELLFGGAKITDVSKLLGHSSLESTQIYTKLSSSIKSDSYKKSHPLESFGEELV